MQRIGIAALQAGQAQQRQTEDVVATFHQRQRDSQKRHAEPDDAEPTRRLQLPRKDADQRELDEDKAKVHAVVRRYPDPTGQAFRRVVRVEQRGLRDEQRAEDGSDAAAPNEVGE